MATSPFRSNAFIRRALKSGAQCKGIKGNECLQLQPPTEFPFCSLIARARALWQLVLHLLETLDRLCEATIPLQNVANVAVDNKPGNIELHRKRVRNHLRVRTITESIPWLQHSMLQALSHASISCSPT